MKSWDRFLVPLPFSRGLFVYGEPIQVPARASEAEMAAALATVGRVLNELTERADLDA